MRSSAFELPVSELEGVAADGAKIYAVARNEADADFALLRFDEWGDPRYAVVSRSPEVTEVDGATERWIYWSASRLLSATPLAWLARSR